MRDLFFEWALAGRTRPVRLDYIRCWYDGEPILATIFCRDSHQREVLTITPRTLLWGELVDCFVDWAESHSTKEGEEYDDVLDLMEYMADFLRPEPARG